MKGEYMNEKHCECGCGAVISPSKRFVSGHNSRFIERKPRKIILKTCGVCGLMFFRGTSKFYRGKYCSEYCQFHDPKRRKTPINTIGDRREMKAQGHPNSMRKDSMRIYRYMAAKALGGALPIKAHVHHFSDNQLVVCQDASYHRLIHTRQTAYKATGDAHKRICCICHKWDDPEKLVFKKRSNGENIPPYHKECMAKRARILLASKRTENTP